MSPAPNAQVLDRTYEMPRIQLDALPEELVEWAKGNGNDVGLSSPLVIGFLQGYNRHPLLFSELPENIQKAVRKGGFTIKDDQLCKFDVIVTMQALSDQQRFRDADEYHLRMQEEDQFNEIPAGVEAAAAELNGRLSAAGGKPQTFASVNVKEGGSARDHVVGGDKLRAIIDKEESEAEGRAKGPKR